MKLHFNFALWAIAWGFGLTVMFVLSVVHPNWTNWQLQVAGALWTLLFVQCFKEKS